jgi:hypothetical protein
MGNLKNMTKEPATQGKPLERAEERAGDRSGAPVVDQRADAIFEARTAQKAAEASVVELRTKLEARRQEADAVKFRLAKLRSARNVVITAAADGDRSATQTAAKQREELVAAHVEVDDALGIVEETERQLAEAERALAARGRATKIACLAGARLARAAAVEPVSRALDALVTALLAYRTARLDHDAAVLSVDARPLGDVDAEIVSLVNGHLINVVRPTAVPPEGRDRLKAGRVLPLAETEASLALERFEERIRISDGAGEPVPPEAA